LGQISQQCFFGAKAAGILERIYKMRYDHIGTIITHIKSGGTT
jgi:hypothetical protein